MSQPKISIIIPMYNAEPWIERCLGSVASQTMAEWECVVVDNKSTDNSLSVAKRYINNLPCAEQFTFVESDINKGPGPARNMGMQHAKGEYLTFLDSDDWVEATRYEKLYAAVEVCAKINNSTSSNPDIVVGATMLKPDVTKTTLLRNYPPSSCFHLYRHEFISQNALIFPPERSSEDSYFVCTCILLAQSWTTTPVLEYNIFQNPNSISRRDDKGRYMEKLKVFQRLLDFSQQHQLLHQYRRELRRIYFRKAFLLSLKEYWHNNHPRKIKEIINIFIVAHKQFWRIR